MLTSFSRLAIVSTANYSQQGRYAVIFLYHIRAGRQLQRLSRRFQRPPLPLCSEDGCIKKPAAKPLLPSLFALNQQFYSPRADCEFDPAVCEAYELV
jgi:hypothetical protein